VFGGDACARGDSSPVLFHILLDPELPTNLALAATPALVDIAIEFQAHLMSSLIPYFSVPRILSLCLLLSSKKFFVPSL